MKTTVALGTVALATVFYGCELQQQMVNEIQADAKDFDQALCWRMRLLQSMTSSPSFGVLVNAWTMVAWALCYVLYRVAGAGDRLGSEASQVARNQSAVVANQGQRILRFYTFRVATRSCELTHSTAAEPPHTVRGAARTKVRW